MVKNKTNKFLCWKSKTNGEPIEGTDRILSAPSKRWAIKHLAFELGVKIEEGDLIIKLPSGEYWCCMYI